MLQMQNIKKKFGDRVLLNDCSLSMNDGERIALIGPNGAGKTTLFRMIMGEEPLDAGEMIIQKDMSIGFLPQEISVIRGSVLIDEVLCCSKEIKDVHKKLDESIIKLSKSNDSNQEKLMEEYGALQTKFEELGGYEYEHKAKRVLAGLGFKESDLLRMTDEFSGGWMMRIALAKLLLNTPDLMMLDEPTNHLDLQALLWFQDYLLTYKGTLIFTSHDRAFIDHVSTRIIDIDSGALVTYKGTYDYYLEEKEKKKELLEGLAKEQDKKIKQAQIFINRFRATASRASSVQSKIKEIEKIDRIVIAKEKKTLHFNFPQPQASGHAVMTLKNVHKSYGDKPVYQGIDLEICKGDKIVLVGSNGAGKSTLLKILSGALAFEEGVRKVGHNVSAGYYPQHRLDVLSENKTCLENMQEVCVRQTETEMRKLLGKFLFPGDMVFNEVSILSGGEKSRLVMAKILANPPNFLLMDEPTNHLDIPSRNILIEALNAFSGTLCFISHDVHFIRKIANIVIEVDNGKLKQYRGDYDYYVYKKALDEKKEKDIISAAKEKEKKKERVNKYPVQPKTDKKGQSAVKQRDEVDVKKDELRKKTEEAEKKLDKMLVRLEELNKIMSDPEFYHSKDFVAIGKEHKVLTETIDRLIAELE